MGHSGTNYKPRRRSIQRPQHPTKSFCETLLNFFWASSTIHKFFVDSQNPIMYCIVNTILTFTVLLLVVFYVVQCTVIHLTNVANLYISVAVQYSGQCVVVHVNVLATHWSLWLDKQWCDL